MCGIVGAVANRNVVELLIAGLKALEYRGYDSAGLCVAQDLKLARLRAAGKVAALENLLTETPLNAPMGIAHTRWATHGAPTTENAHPIVAGSIAVVHNGIIENHESLRAELLDAGVTFNTETDSEVVAHLINRSRANGLSLLEAVLQTLRRLRGAYALAVLDQTDPEHIIGARLGSPLVAGLGFGENFVASDVHALLPVTNRFIDLHEGDVVQISRDGVEVYDVEGHSVTRTHRESELSASSVDRGPYRHFMLKEIFEQPHAISETLEGRLIGDPLRPVLGNQVETVLKSAQNIHIIACGTSYHAGLVARHWIESIAGIPCQAEVASEYRYRDAVVPPTPFS